MTKDNNGLLAKENSNYNSSNILHGYVSCFEKIVFVYAKRKQDNFFKTRRMPMQNFVEKAMKPNQHPC